jgi:hypothetical protein
MGSGPINGGDGVVLIFLSLEQKDAQNRCVNRSVLLVLILFGCTLIGPVFAWGNSGGQWRAAWRAWLETLQCYAILAVPGAITALCMWLLG